MLHRQKALLAILEQVGGEASTLQMMKWAFLLSQETPSHGGKTFYQFIPYRFGPYSFTLNRETDTLIRNGFVEKADKKTWELTPLGREQAVNLPKPISQDIAAVTKQYGGLSGSDLIDKVYAHYPWFTVNSDLPGKRREQRPIADMAIYTAGYEGKTVDEFLNLLMRSGIRRLIDVRFNPISRRYGFHKSTLKRLCSSLDIDYQHLPGLGIPGSARADLTSLDSYIALFKEYHCGLANRWDDLQATISLLNSEPSVLVCMEANPECCHRNVLAQHLVGMMDLPIKHLG
ncbi:MAG: DUF488 family protein [Cyanobacteria bacterium P01_G01_bin.38]